MTTARPRDTAGVQQPNQQSRNDESQMEPSAEKRLARTQRYVAIASLVVNAIGLGMAIADKL